MNGDKRMSKAEYVYALSQQYLYHLDKATEAMDRIKAAQDDR